MTPEELAKWQEDHGYPADIDPTLEDELGQQHGRAMPAKTLKGIDPLYHPRKNDQFVRKYGLASNCSMSVLSDFETVTNPDKYFEYFWHHKGETQDLQTPGCMMMTLAMYQTFALQNAIENGFKVVHIFPSCHSQHSPLILLVKNNPIYDVDEKYLKNKAEVEERIAGNYEAKAINPRFDVDADLDDEPEEEEIEDERNYDEAID